MQFGYLNINYINTERFYSEDLSKTFKLLFLPHAQPVGIGFL